MRIISQVLESETWIRQLFLLGFGIYLILFPNLGLQLLLLAVVILCIVLGAYNVFRFFLNQKKTAGYTGFALLGGIQIVIGVFLYLNLASASALSIMLFALFLIFNGMLDLKDYWQTTDKKNLYSKVSLLLMVLNILLGIILVASPFHFLAAQPVFIGLALIVINGIDLYKGKYLKQNDGGTNNE